MWHKIWEFLGKRARQSWRNAKRAHKKGLKARDGRYRLLVGLALLAMFTWGLADTSASMAVSFFFSGSMAIYFGYVYRGEHVMGYVLVGGMLTSAAWRLIPPIRDSFAAGDVLGTAVLIAVGIVIWLRGSRLGKGG